MREINLHFFALGSDFCGGFAAEKIGQPALEALAETVYGPDAEFELLGEGVGFGNAVAKALKQALETTFFAQESFELLDLCLVFLADEHLDGCGVGGGQGFDEIDQFVVIGEVGSQVLLVTNDKVLFAVMQAIHVLVDPALESAGQFLKLDLVGDMVRVRFSGFPEVLEGLGGDGAWVVAVRQDATGSMTPAPKAHEAGGKDFRLLEEEVPRVGRRWLLRLGISANHGWAESISRATFNPENLEQKLILECGRWLGPAQLTVMRWAVVRQDMVGPWDQRLRWQRGAGFIGVELLDPSG
jgi:hypothetical protein